MVCNHQQIFWVYQIKAVEMDGTRVKEKRNLYRVLVRKPEGRRPLGRPRRRWEYSIVMYFKAIGLEALNWIYLAQDIYKGRTLTAWW